MTPDRRFAHLESHLQASWMIRGADAIARALCTAAAGSTTAYWIRRTRDRLLSAPIDDRVRAVAAFTLSAAIGHLLLLRFVPPHIAPALPTSFWVLVAGTALVVALVAKRLRLAWTSSVISRFWTN